MTILGFLIPLALLMGLCGLGAFFWAMKSGQFEDLDGAANRILIDEENPADPDAATGKTAGRLQK
ncbi:cbb3-type cytochrome oxidase assembly protein CcoS [Novosphingobium sp. 1949]|uniref:Cbb3-type cytochrome oxidase assembly protein CcoS n=1 Tax=Novosphingobium organovorum TaxID=2930092 RepID=A0ABT0BG23_9SPHN|nr:cbb3-type cytochrome oxidase assembly protein CcoS [Novosphingobium organovorum]MCJ2183870.1 cbb3-type cytochrome oxidase assembly protein CcoS [Novosphingobium organovorum]